MCERVNGNIYTNTYLCFQKLLNHSYQRYHMQREHFNASSWLVDWGLTSHQQLRSYGDGTSVYSPIQRIREARDFNASSWLADWGLTSHQQLRSYGDGTSVFVPSNGSEKPGILTLQFGWLIGV